MFAAKPRGEVPQFGGLANGAFHAFVEAKLGRLLNALSSDPYLELGRTANGLFILRRRPAAADQRVSDLPAAGPVLVVHFATPAALSLPAALKGEPVAWKSAVLVGELVLRIGKTVPLGVVAGWCADPAAAGQVEFVELVELVELAATVAVFAAAVAAVHLARLMPAVSPAAASTLSDTTETAVGLRQATPAIWRLVVDSERIQSCD